MLYIMTSWDINQENIYGPYISTFNSKAVFTWCDKLRLTFDKIAPVFLSSDLRHGDLDSYNNLFYWFNTKWGKMFLTMTGIGDYSALLKIWVVINLA